MDQNSQQYNEYAHTRQLPEQIHLSSVQSFRQCALSMCTASQHKAPSFDKVSNAVLAKAPLAVARHYHPSLSKVQFTASEPFEFKGSISHPLLKPGKIASTAKHHRSISL